MLPGGDENFNAQLVIALEVLGRLACRIAAPENSTAPASVIICSQIHRIDSPEPLMIVAPGGASEYLPSVARALRAAHRRVGCYALLDPVSDPTGPDWPDAPVRLVHSGKFHPQMRLRGWEVVKVNSIDECADQLIVLSSLI